MPYWLEESLRGVLPALWMSLGVGLPWALALRPRAQWSSRALVLALALALGPAFTGGWMLLLGVAGAQISLPLLKPAPLMLGSVFIALAGCAFAWRKRARIRSNSAKTPPLAVDEKIIICLIAVAVILRWIHIAWWCFSAYDALWVYGYQGRLYFLEGMIPHSIDYYPQFLQSQFAGAQILGGAINDHVARMTLPFLHIGAIFAAYLLGERLVNRRVGLMAAALWSLHPYVAQWSIVGDLEIPLAFLFTLAAVFFLRAWRQDGDYAGRRRDALLSGLILGIALYTKPTAGAFIWGVALMLLLEFARTRCKWETLKPRLVVAFWAGLACLPFGGIWYLRNWLLGHEVVTLPAEIWLTQARRSGDYLSWLLLALFTGFAALAVARRMTIKAIALGGFGLALTLAGALASNPALFPARFDPPGSYIRPSEAALLALGLALILFSFRSAPRATLVEAQRDQIAIGIWALALALPYFVTFLFSYSYHYRLGFAITPLLILPSAIALAQILKSERIAKWRIGARRAYHVLLIALGLPGVLVVALDADLSRIWLLERDLDSDIKKYQATNPSLMEVVFGLEAYERENDNAPIALAPGEERLRFFFPQMRIIDAPLTSLDEAESIGATHFVYGAKARQAYANAGIDPLKTQLIMALGRMDLFELKKAHYDGTFSYELYQIGDLPSRFNRPAADYLTSLSERDARFGDMRLLAVDNYPPLLVRDTPITLQTAWQATADIARDLRLELELYNLGRQEATYQWRFQLGVGRHGAYSTLFWDPGEVVKDTTIVRLPADDPPPKGDDYVLRLRVVDPETGELLPLSVKGVAAGDYWQLKGRLRITR